MTKLDRTTAESDRFTVKSDRSAAGANRFMVKSDRSTAESYEVRLITPTTKFLSVIRAGAGIQPGG